MIDRIKRLSKTDLIKSSFYSAVATLVKVGTAFAMSKIIAIYLGPDGMGLIGQLTNFIAIAMVVAGGALGNGIVKYVAEYNMSRPDEMPALLSTAFKIVLLCGLVSGACMIIFPVFFSQLILLSTSYKVVFVIFGCTVLLYGLNNLLLSILNGYKAYRKFNIVNIITSVLGLLVSMLFIYYWRVEGALIALVINQSVVFIATLFLLRKEKWLVWSNFTLPINKVQAGKMVGFIMMALVTSACIPVSQMYVRSYMIQHLSLKDAGIWESVNRISNVYLLFVTTSLTTYYLPRLSEISEERELRSEIFKVYKVVMPIVIVCSAGIYLFRGLIIKLLFTGEFNDANSLFLFQMLGDTLKIASWLLAFQMVAKAMTKLYIITEILFSGLFVVFSVFFLKNFGLVGATYAFALNYFLYLILMVFMFKRLLFTNR